MVAAEVVLVAVAGFVVVHVVVEVAVDDDGAEFQDDFGAVGGPSGPGDPEPVFYDEGSGPLHQAGGCRPACRPGLGVADGRGGVRPAGDRPGPGGEVAVAGSRGGAGL